MGNQEANEGRQSSFASFRLIGLGFWQAWWMLVLCSPAILPFAYRDVFPIDPVLWVLGLVPLGYLIAVAASRKLSPFLKRPYSLIVTAAAAFVGTFAMGLLTSGIMGDALVIPYILAAVLMSLGNAWLLIMWGELWSTLATGRVGRFLYVSYAFAFLLFFVVSVLPSLVKVVVIALLPAISALILKNAEREPRREPTAIAFDMEPISLSRVFAYLILVSIAYGISQAAMTVLAPESGFVTPMFLFAGACIAALALNIFITQPPVEAFSLHRPILPALTVGLILMVLLPSDFAFIGGGLVILAIYSLDMLVMLVSTDVSFRSRVPVAITLGLSILVTRTGTLVGTVLSREAFNGAMLAPEFIMQTLLLCTIVVVLAGTLIFSLHDLQKLYRPQLMALKRIEPLKKKCDHIGKICGLTARELEVLTLLSAGRSIPYICDELVIAKGTAKHHVSNIYRKLGVGDRQSLHDVIEQGSVGKGAL